MRGRALVLVAMAITGVAAALTLAEIQSARDGGGRILALAFVAAAVIERAERRGS